MRAGTEKPEHVVTVDVRTSFGGALVITCSCGGLRHRLSNPPETLDRLLEIAEGHR